MTPVEAVLPSRLYRRPQGVGTFEPGDPGAGYYNDLTVELERLGPTVAQAQATFDRLTRDRSLTNPIDVAQLGLGALQAAASSSGWLPLAHAAAEWLADDLDAEGRLAFLFPMPHTFDLSPPWYSAMAQGQAASLLVRMSAVLDDGRLAGCAGRAVAPLVDARLGLVGSTLEGPVLQEYPTTPPAHVLNGWIFALWGLYDVGCFEPAGHEARDGAAAAFDEGARSLAERLHRYELGAGWSRYDLYPHPVVHVASPFYHRLHAAQLAATARLRPDLPQLASTAERWAAAARNPLVVTSASLRKALHRLIVPRRARR